MKFKTYIVDTTLRDGEQSAGIAFNKEEKVKLAIKMDAIGVHQIEVGIPSLDASEGEAIKEIIEKKQKAIISAWTPMDIKAIKVALECKPEILHISAPVSYVHIYSKLKKNKQWLRGRLAECVACAKDVGQEVTVGFEDASRADISFVISVAMQLQSMGIKRIRYADTVGVLTPHQVADIVKNLKHYTDLEIEMHVHNDFGMAVANSIEAVKAGARYIDCTFMGIGERAGNCDFLKFIKASDELLELGMTRKAVYEMQKEVVQVLNNHSKQVIKIASK